MSGVLCDRIMNVKIKEKMHRTVVRPALAYRGRYSDIEESTGEKIGGRRNVIATVDVRSYEAGQDKK